MQGTLILKKILGLLSREGSFAEYMQLYRTRHFSRETGVSFSMKKGYSKSTLIAVAFRLFR